jgi:hypothetical protein
MDEFVDLRSLRDDGFILHFGGRVRSVNAETLGRTLVALSDALSAINDDVNPGYRLEVVIEALEPGSFRARIRANKKLVGNIFGALPIKEVLAGLLVLLIYDLIRGQDDKTTVIVKGDVVIVETKDSRIVIDRPVYEAKKALRQKDRANAHIGKAIEALQADDDVKEFGIGESLEQEELVLKIPRREFPLILEHAMPPINDENDTIDVPAHLSIKKAVFERSRRKWEFIWNGVPISATITDRKFFDRLIRRQVYLQHGDAFDAVLRIKRSRDPVSGAWVNRHYEVIAVGDTISRAARHVDAFPQSDRRHD